jgi:hypothetical protein
MYAPQNNSPFTALSEGISATATTIVVADGTVLPAAPNVLTIGVDDSAELVLMTAKSSNILTVTRAFNGTTAQAWDKGAMIYRAITAQDISALQENVKEVDGKVGGIKAEAVAEAVAVAEQDATNKANAAKQDAINAAAGDATSKANKAKSDAVSEANEYADSVASTAKTEAVTAAATDATSKANAAKAAAIETASGDATTKANNAQTNAVASAKSYTDAEIVKVNNKVTTNANAITTLDGKVANKADKANAVSATLSAGSWSDGSYVLTVSGVTATSNQEILPALNITAEQLEALQSANIQDGGQANGSVTLKAFGDVPTIDIPIRVIVRGDA